MQIIKKRHIEIQCKNCNAVLGVELNDIIYDDSGHGHPYIPYKCFCVECKRRVEIPDSKMPREWKEELDYQ